MRSSTALKQVVLVVLVVAAGISLTRGVDNAVSQIDGSQDFQWAPSRTLLEHTDPYAAYLDSVDQSSLFLAQAPNYPAAGLVLLWPLAAWNWSVAKVLWAFSNTLFTVVILLSLFRILPVDTPRTTKILLATLFLMSTPWRNSVGNGQHSLFSLAFFLLAVVVSSRDFKVAGVPLAVSWFKYTIAFPLSLFFARSLSGLVTILVAAAAYATLTLLVSFWVDSSLIDLLFGPLRVAQSATGGGELDVFAIASRLGVAPTLLPAAAATIILGVTYLAVRRDSDTLSCLSTLSLAAMTVVFHLGYDFVVLVIPLSYALRERGMTKRAKYYLLVVGLIWFIDKLAVAVSTQTSLVVYGFPDSYFWLKVVVFYGALLADWFYAFGSRSQSTRAIPLS